ASQVLYGPCPGRWSFQSAASVLDLPGFCALRNPAMRAVVAATPGGPEVLQLQEVDDPVPGPSELLVRVHATALNRADLLQRRGLYAAPPGAGPVLGLECAGVVIGVGEGAAPDWLGKEVMSLL